MPKRGEKNVFVNGICTCPPLPREAQTLGSSAGLRLDRRRPKPWCRRRASSHASPCFGTGLDHSGIRAVLVTHERCDLGAERSAVELEGLFAATIEEYVGLDLHGDSLRSRVSDPGLASGR